MIVVIPAEVKNKRRWNWNLPRRKTGRKVGPVTMDWCKQCRDQHFVELSTGLCSRCGGW